MPTQTTNEIQIPNPMIAYLSPAAIKRANPDCKIQYLTILMDAGSEYAILAAFHNPENLMLESDFLAQTQIFMDIIKFNNPILHLWVIADSMEILSVEKRFIVIQNQG